MKKKRTIKTIESRRKFLESIAKSSGGAALMVMFGSSFSHAVEYPYFKHKVDLRDPPAEGTPPCVCDCDCADCDCATICTCDCPEGDIPERSKDGNKKWDTSVTPIFNSGVENGDNMSQDKNTKKLTNQYEYSGY